MLRRFPIAVLVLASVLALPRTARADEEAASPYFTIGVPLALASTVSDTVQWGIMGPTNLSSHWAWHMIPGVGPVVGYQAFGSEHCGAGHDEPQCNVPHGLVQGVEILYFTCEMAGLVLVGVGLYKRTQPRFPAASADTKVPWVLPRLAISQGGISLGLSASF